MSTEAKNARRRARYAANPDKYRARVRAYVGANSEKVREKNRAGYEVNKAERDERNRLSYAKNREKRMAAVKAWQVANPDAVRLIKRASQARRRARLAGAEGSFTVEDVQQILKRQRWRCAGCGADITGGYHLDHIVALARGGSNWPSNLQGLCAPCNSSKGTKDHERWIEERLT